MANRIISMGEIAADLRALQSARGISDEDMTNALRLFGFSIGAPIYIGDMVDERPIVPQPQPASKC